MTGKGHLASMLCGSGMALALIAALPAAAQEIPPAPSGDEAQTAAPVTDTGPTTTSDAPAGDIVVTGSRIRGAAPVGSAVTTLSNTDIVQSGRVTIDRAIKELPQVLDLGVSENSRGQSGGSGNIVYGNSINLRGIGPFATLILVDGHRVVNNGRTTDPSVLPTLGVERVEVVADGASAIYGSDAVAGVVNLIPRRSLNGVEAFARAGVSSEGDYHEYALGAAAGKRWDRGQVMLAYEHVERSNLSGDDRDFFTSNQTRFGGGDYRVTRCAPGTIRANGTTYAIPGGGLTQANAGALVAGTTNRCDDLQGQDLIPSQTYDSANGTFTFDVTDWLTVFGDGFYSYRKFYRTGPFPAATLTVPETNAFFVRPAGFAGTSYTVDLNFKGLAPSGDSYGHGESWQVTPGIRVKLPHDFQFEAILDHGRTDDNSISRTGTNNAALNAALASSNPATAFDPYGGGRTSQAVLNGIFNQIFLAPTIGRFTGYEARLNGSLFHLPGGDVKTALGYEGQEFKISLGTAIGGPTTPLTFRNFGRRVDSGYAQLVVPIFGAENATGGFQELVIDAAVRYDKYSDVGDTTNPKVGVNWSPIRGLKLRGSYGTSFRAPSFPEIFGNSNRLYVQNYQNPAGGAPITGVAVSGANPDLKPETAETWSVGADWEVMPRLRLSSTFFSVDYRNKVVALLSDLAVLTRASQFDGTGIIIQGAAAGERIAQLAATGIAVAGTFPGGDPRNVSLFIDGRNLNLGQSLTRGIDFSADYRLPTTSAGDFGLNFNMTYLTEYKTKQTPNAPTIDQLNKIFQPIKFKARAILNWQSEFGLGALVRASHVGTYTNTAINPHQKVKSFDPIDLQLNWVIDKEANPFVFSIEARNVFNERPPYVNIAPSGNGSGGYDATAADPIGRVFSASVRKSF